MRKLFTILSFIFSTTLFAQSDNDVISALKAADASKFSSYFSSTLDIKLPQKDEMKNISKSEAASAMTNFFTANNINGFEVISQREMSGTMYIAGKLKNGSENYSITVMLKNKGGDLTVITVRIG